CWLFVRSTPFGSSTRVVTTAADHVLVAGPEFAPVAFVVRVSETPLTDTVVLALTVVVPAVGGLMTTVQEPVPPEVVQLFPAAGTKTALAPPALLSEKVITVPSGAFTNPVPGFTFT